MAGSAGRNLIEQIKRNPVVAEGQLATDGLASLLSSREEQEHIQELVEQSRLLDINRYLGYKAIVTQHNRGSGAIRKVSVSNPIATGAMYNLPGAPMIKRSAEQNLTSINPSRESFRIGEYRSLAVPWRMTAFWEVYPFDEESGESVVDLELQGKRASLPSANYVAAWNNNRA